MCVDIDHNIAGTFPGQSDLVEYANAPNTIVLFGDSMTLRSGLGSAINATYKTQPNNGVADDATSVSFYLTGWWLWANAYLGQRFEVLSYSGVSGDTYTDMLARLSSDVIAYNPKYCFVQSSNVCANGETAAAELASLKSIVNGLKNAGIIPIVDKPGFNVAIAGAENDEWTDLTIQSAQWLKKQGVICVNAQKGMGDSTDITNPLLHADYALDGTHYSMNGAQKVGENIYNQLNNLIPAVPIGPQFNTDYQTGFLNPLNAGTNAVTATNGRSGNVGNNWTLGANAQLDTEAVACAKLARTDGELGEWTTLTFSGDAGGAAEYCQLTTATVTSTNSGFTIGDRLRTYVELQVTTAFTNLNFPTMRLFHAGGNTGGITPDIPSTAADLLTVTSQPLIMAIPDVVLDATTIGSDTCQLLIEFFPDGAGTIAGVIKFGRVWIEKVS